MQRSPVSEWQALSALFDEADGLDPPALHAWLARPERVGDPLVPQLRRMLAARDAVEASDFLVTLPRLPELGAHPPLFTPGEGLAVGPYRLLHHLGSGGMAEVWLAERDDGTFRRRVAIKLLHRRAGAAQRDSVALRFERERDILASLAHPHIAALYDAGVTTAGQPWLALEYVEGRPFDDWCDAERLDVRARVRLFRQVLLAVQYAHANLVMHRDLKPANILVARAGEVRLLDFGIAKLIDPGGAARDDTELTRAAGRMLTPRYASPEQLRGEALTTACDVYSLGVVLYELLCGERPYELRVESAAQLEHAILEVDPRAPSRRALGSDSAAARSSTPAGLRRMLAGDLDAIVLQALAKRPAQRYASVDALRADLDRWLDGDAVLARAPSRWYRWGKFVARHRLMVSVGSAAVCALAALAVVALLQARQAQHESARAIAARDFMIDMFGRADPEKARGTSITAGELLESGRVDVEHKLQQQPELQVELLQGIASIQSGMGDHTKAAQTLKAVEDLYRRLGRAPELVLAILDRAENAWNLGDMNTTATLLAEAQRVDAGASSDARVKARLAQLGGILASDRSDSARARALFSQAADEAARAYGPNHVKTLRALRDIANAESDAGNNDAASRIQADVVRRAAANPAVEPRQHAEFAFEHVRDLYDAGRVREALTAVEPASSQCDSLVGPNAEPCRKLQQVRVQSALRLGWPDRALSSLAPLTAMTNDTLSPARQASACALLVRMLAALGRPDDARALHERLQGLAEAGPEMALAEQFKVVAALALADSALRLGDAPQALRWAERALRREPHDGVSPRVFAWAHVLRGIALTDLGRYDDALAELRKGNTAHAAALGEQHPMTLLFSLNEARALALVGRPNEALQLVQRAEAPLRDAFGADAPTYLNVLRLQAWMGEAGLPSSAAKQTMSSRRDARLIFN